MFVYTYVEIITEQLAKNEQPICHWSRMERRNKPGTHMMCMDWAPMYNTYSAWADRPPSVSRFIHRKRFDFIHIDHIFNMPNLEKVRQEFRKMIGSIKNTFVRIARQSFREKFNIQMFLGDFTSVELSKFRSDDRLHVYRTRSNSDQFFHAEMKKWY